MVVRIESKREKNKRKSDNLGRIDNKPPAFLLFTQRPLLLIVSYVTTFLFIQQLTLLLFDFNCAPVINFEIAVIAALPYFSQRFVSPCSRSFGNTARFNCTRHVRIVSFDGDEIFWQKKCHCLQPDNRCAQIPNQRRQWGHPIVKTKRPILRKSNKFQKHFHKIHCSIAAILIDHWIRRVNWNFPKYFPPAWLLEKKYQRSNQPTTATTTATATTTTKRWKVLGGFGWHGNSCWQVGELNTLREEKKCQCFYYQMARCILIAPPPFSSSLH